MAQTNYTPIQLYYSTTAAAVPVNTNLLNGELAININDGKLYYKDNSGTVQVIATKGAGTIGGSTTQIQYNNAGALAGSADMTYTSATNTVLLTKLNLTNALGTIYGGTGLTSYTTGDLLYSSASNTLAKLAIGTANYILTVNSGGTNVQWSAPSSISVSTATNLAGGVAGSVPYQSGASTTTFLAIGAADRVMTSSGTAPQWVTALTGLTGVSSSSITNTSLTSGRVVYSGTGGLQTNSANLTFDGTTLTTTGVSNTGTSTIVKLLTVGNTSFNGTTVFAAATPAKLYMGTGTVTDVTSAVSATNTTGAIASLAITPIAASNTGVTYTNASTLYIAGAPSAGTNISITNPYALYVAAGASYFGGAVTYNSGLTLNGVLSVTDTTDSTSTTTGSIKTAGGMGIAKSLYVGGIVSGVATSSLTAFNAAATSTGTGFQTNPACFSAVNTVAGREVAGLYITDGTNNTLISQVGGTTAVYKSGTQVLTFTTAGLAVNGTLSATGVSTFTSRIDANVASASVPSTTNTALYFIGAAGSNTYYAGQYYSGATGHDVYMGMIPNSVASSSDSWGLGTVTSGVYANCLYMNGNGNILIPTKSFGIGLTTDPNTKFEMRVDTTTAGSEPNILLNNRGANTTSTTPYSIGGVYGAGFRDVRSPGYVAGMEFYRNSASSGLNSAGEIRFYTSGDAGTLAELRATYERARFGSTGTLTINPGGTGVNNQQTYLAFYGGGNATAAGVLRFADGSLSGGATNYWDIGRDNSFTGNFTFTLNGTQKGYIDITTGAYIAVSDRRSKKNIVPLQYGLSSVMAMNPVMYHMVEELDTDKKHIGLIAQETKAIIDESVDDLKDDTKQFYGLDKSGLVPVLIKAVQEQQAMIEDLKTRLATAGI